MNAECVQDGKNIEREWKAWCEEENNTNWKNVHYITTNMCTADQNTHLRGKKKEEWIRKKQKQSYWFLRAEEIVGEMKKADEDVNMQYQKWE